MNRLLSILLSLFILFLVYLWINHITTDPWSSDEPDTFSIAEQEESARTPYPQQSTLDETHDKGTEQQREEELGASPGDEVADTDRAEAFESEMHAAKAVQPTETEQAMTLKPEQQNLVIAGNFLERSNAEKRVRELRDFGFANAEVVNFQLSEYHTACAGRYANLDEAQRVARKLKNNYNIDAYVRHGN